MCVARILAVESRLSEMPERWVRACHLDAFDKRQIVGVTVEGQPLVIVRDGDSFFAAERACPHEGADLAQGRCTSARLYCPRHLAWFDLHSGAVSPGWFFRPLKIYPSRLVSSHIQINLGAKGSAGAA